MMHSVLLEAISPLPPPARLGEVVGKYRLDRIIGTGGMAVVVAATHLHLHQCVAIKFMSPVPGDEDARVQRFLLEARSAARIQSEHVARVLDVDTLPTGTPYIVMEYLDGHDLSALLEQRGWLPVPEAVDYVLQACEAIAEAHVMGVVHRDLKPGNLFCCRRPDGAPLVKVLDFGVSKLLPKAAAAFRARSSTGPHVIMGTPLYASPEQLRCSADVDARTDIWALGVILYELVAGKPPFEGETLSQLRARITRAPLRPLRELRPEAPAELCELVARCLAKEPSERFQTVADLTEALARFAPRGSLLSVERVKHIFRAQRATREVEPTLPSASNGPRAGAAPAPGSPGRSLWIALAAVAAAVTGASLLAAWAGLAGHPAAARALASAATPAHGAPAGALIASATSAGDSHVVVTSAPAAPTRSAPAAREAPVPSPGASMAPAQPSPAIGPRRPTAPRVAPGTSEFGGLQ